MYLRHHLSCILPLVCLYSTKPIIADQYRVSRRDREGPHGLKNQSQRLLGDTPTSCAFKRSNKMDRLKELKKGAASLDDVAIEVDNDKGTENCFQQSQVFLDLAHAHPSYIFIVN